MTQKLSDPMRTCAACSRVLPANDEGILPTHARPGDFDRGFGPCPGSRTRGYPPRPLLEIKPLYIEMVDESGNGEDKHLRIIASAAQFLNQWLGSRNMPRDDDSLVQLSAHANNAQHAALRLMSPRASMAAEARRHRSGQPLGESNA
jgi:hypothetical protein